MKMLFAPAILLLITCNALSAQDAGAIYAANCAHCHGPDGGADTVLGRALKIGDLRSSGVKKLSHAELASIIGKGMDRGRMPGFEKKLGPDVVLQLASYVQNIDHEPAVSEPKKSLEKHSAKATDAKNEFAVSCAHCHGADGSGDTVLGRSLKLRDMRSPAAQHYSDSELAAIISTGMDRGRMPGFRKKLGPEMVDQLASYVRVLGGKPPIMAAEKAISAAAANDAPPVSDRPAAQVEVKALAPVRPETQPQQEEGKNTSTVHTVTSAALLPVVVPMSGHGARTELVDLNSASKKILMTLPGIAESDAANIVAGRPYKSTLQFKTRNIVSANTYAQIADRVIAKQPGRTKQPTRGTVGASGSQ